MLDFIIGYLSALLTVAGVSGGVGLYVKRNPKVIFRAMNRNRKRQLSKAAKRDAA